MDPQEPLLPKRRVLTADITVGSFAEQLAAMVKLAGEHRSSYVCCVNAHMTVECHWDPRFATVVNEADLATPDGMPVLKALRRFHGVGQERVAGNDLMPALLAEAAHHGLRVFFYGGSEHTLGLIRDRALKELPGLVVAGAHAPPFAPLEAMDLEAEAARINATGAHLVMVSLGCPKQERFMAAMKGKVHALMIGLGGAFLLYAGLDRRAPAWMRNASLEWLYRLWLEPRRLWKRYLVTNTVFLWLVFKRLVAAGDR
jgi:N-acetylglucosaminyldiphosphoundecaprenol N-acetyl-beta-D-mannosaminyltransferase